MRLRLSTLPALALTLVLGACSTPSPESLAQNDPWEKTNRDIFEFNLSMDRAILRPVARGYRDVVPEFAREGVHNFLTNLNSPVILANDVLQLNGDKAGNTLGRILLNTTVGVGGLIDVASKVGLPHHENDFGITFGRAGAAEGSYLMLPFVGPRPPRDLIGVGVDVAMDPFTWLIFPGDDTLLIVRGGMGVLDLRTSQLGAVETIERSSIDFYATTRNLYRQSRNAKINEGNTELDDLPNL
jgi:phospholipid-binding lipoprotein MlaA